MFLLPFLPHFCLMISGLLAVVLSLGFRQANSREGHWKECLKIKFDGGLQCFVFFAGGFLWFSFFFPLGAFIQESYLYRR